MIPGKFAGTAIVLLACRAGNAWSSAPAESPAGAHGEHKEVRLAADFPSLESFYPVASRRLREEGTATVHACVDPTGQLIETPTVVTSSGHPMLDAAALELATAGSGHYVPASENGVAVKGCVSFNVAFKLREPPAPLPRVGPDFPNLEAYYPLDARLAGQEGAAVVRFCIDPAGTLTETPTIVTSSGNPSLDAGAVNLATAGSGHYLPASQNGVAVAGCGQFRVAFKLNEEPALVPNDPRFPTIYARAMKLDEEYTRRITTAMGKFGPNARPVLVPTYPDTASTIRQYARAAESALDEGSAVTADFLDDVDYLGKSPDIPAAERSAFTQVWPVQRAALTAKIRAVLDASRDLVRLMDEMADYLAFRTVETPKPAGARAGLLPVPAQDAQIAAIQERARVVMERLRSAVEALEGSSTLQ